MQELFQLVQQLAAAHGPSGDEGAVREVIRTLAEPFADVCSTDALGNLIVHRRGCGPRVLFAAHMDSIGLIVTHIEKNGFLRFGKVGGLNLYALPYTPVRFAGGIRGLVGVNQDADPKKPSVEELYIDIGAKSKEEAEKLVHIGDTAVYDTPTFTAGGHIVSPYLDNRISCVVLLSVLERLESSPNDLYFVFTTQEELGLRGAKTAAYAIDPDYATAVDVTLSDDVPGAKHNGSSVLGKGAAVKIMDGSVICHPKMVEKLTSLAREKDISFQTDVIRSGGTDAGAILVSRAGVYTGGICIPCRYVHSPAEMVDCADVQAAVELVKAFACCELPPV